MGANMCNKISFDCPAFASINATGSAFADALPNSVANRIFWKATPCAIFGTPDFGPIVSTGHGATRNSSSATDPSANFCRPPRPRVPITRRSIPSCSISDATMEATGPCLSRVVLILSPKWRSSTIFLNCCSAAMR